MTIVNGRLIAQSLYENIKADVATLERVPKLTAITCAPNFETLAYLNLKKQKAAFVGIDLEVVELSASITTEGMKEAIEEIAATTDGIVLQLPIPEGLSREEILATIPAHQDPDGFAYGVEEGACVPPVVGAILAIAAHHDISFLSKKIVVLGQGRLVGAPMTAYLQAQKLDVTSFVSFSDQQLVALKEADIIISGIGQPEYLTAEMVKEGVVIFDAGTSEEGGVLRGDVQADVAAKASLSTPVPGGIGPITIAVLLQNLVSLVR
jgi:methylenetetrahydrofolate dehydrogenase (NADP+)/methenyltetrahydrofolate cyclohydrolase